jgi:hypothetical protein
MLSFEISAIDVVLLVAMLVLLILLVTQRRSRSMAEPRSIISSQQRFSEELDGGEINVENGLNKQPVESFRGCIHQLGYLKGMAQNTSVPDECCGCPKVLTCMFRSE